MAWRLPLEQGTASLRPCAAQLDPNKPVAGQTSSGVHASALFPNGRSSARSVRSHVSLVNTSTEVLTHVKLFKAGGRSIEI